MSPDALISVTVAVTGPDVGVVDASVNAITVSFVLPAQIDHVTDVTFASSALVGSWHAEAGQLDVVITGPFPAATANLPPFTVSAVVRSATAFQQIAWPAAANMTFNLAVSSTSFVVGCQLAAAVVSNTRIVPANPLAFAGSATLDHLDAAIVAASGGAGARLYNVPSRPAAPYVVPGGVGDGSTSVAYVTAPAGPGQVVAAAATTAGLDALVGGAPVPLNGIDVGRSSRDYLSNVVAGAAADPPGLEFWAYAKDGVTWRPRASRPRQR